MQINVSALLNIHYWRRKSPCSQSHDQSQGGWASEHLIPNHIFRCGNISVSKSHQTRWRTRIYCFNLFSPVPHLLPLLYLLPLLLVNYLLSILPLDHLLLLNPLLPLHHLHPLLCLIWEGGGYPGDWWLFSLCRGPRAPAGTIQR